MKQVSVLFVCMGNICRSPTAEGVFRHKVNSAGLDKQIHIDSAGTHAYHVGEPPDQRAQAAALKRGFDLSTQRARRVHASDFEEYDFVMAMDEANYADLVSICPGHLQEKINLFLDFAQTVIRAKFPTRITVVTMVLSRF